jgi:hypothetical protein
MMRKFLAVVCVALLVGGCAKKDVVNNPPTATTGFADKTAAAGCPSAACDQLFGQVEAGTKIDSVPTDLTPSLKNLKADLRRPDGGDCTVLPMGGLKDAQQPCIFDHGKPDAPLVVLIGDSQAWAWSTTFDKISAEKGYRFGLTYHAGCKLPDLQFPEDFGYTDAHCKQWVKDVVDWVNQQNPSVVISASAHSSRYNHDQYATGYANRLREIHAQKLFVMSDVPTLYQDATSCLPAHPSNALKCSTPTNNAVKSDDFQATADAAKQGNATFVDVIPFFCTTSTCPAIIGPNFAAYQDLYHPTSTYAEQLAPVLKDALKL